MSQRRKLIIIALVLLAVLLVIVIPILLSGRSDNKDSYQKVCESLIDAIAKKDYEAGYNLLSSSARSTYSLESWRDQTSAWGNVYTGAEVTLTDRTEVEAPEGSQSTKVHLSYTITNPIATSDFECTATKEDGKHVVDGFSSQLRQDGQ